MNKTTAEKKLAEATSKRDYFYAQSMVPLTKENYAQKKQADWECRLWQKKVDHYKGLVAVAARREGRKY